MLLVQHFHTSSKENNTVNDSSNEAIRNNLVIWTVGPTKRLTCLLLLVAAVNQTI